MSEDVRDLALRYATSTEKVLILTRAGHKHVGHIEGLMHGGVKLLERQPEGRVRVSIWYADIDSIASFEEEPVDDVGDSLQDLGARLRAEAEQWQGMSEAERLAHKRIANAR